MFSFEICDIFKNTYFEEHLQTATSELIVNSNLLIELTLSWRRPISYRNQSIDLLCKSMD